MDAAEFRAMVARVENAAPQYEIGQLQHIRKQLRGLSKLPGRRIFNEVTIFDEWAFHYGGRSELQFNIGLDQFEDGTLAIRTGVAFSLERSQSLPDWQVLIPRIARFNEYFRLNPTDFANLDMWHWNAGGRSKDRYPAPITPAIVGDETFIFLGSRQSPDAFDPHIVLAQFDRLLDLYRYVQDGPTVASEIELSVSPALDYDNSGVEQKRSGFITATFAERILNIELRHNELQNRLIRKLASEGHDAKLEVKHGLKSVDLVVRRADGSFWLFEVKTATSARQCIREAIGQLLDYAYWPTATLPTKMVVVGDAPANEDSSAYLERLNQRFPAPLDYLHISLN